MLGVWCIVCWVVGLALWYPISLLLIRAMGIKNPDKADHGFAIIISGLIIMISPFLVPVVVPLAACYLGSRTITRRFRHDH